MFRDLVYLEYAELSGPRRRGDLEPLGQGCDLLSPERRGMDSMGKKRKRKTCKKNRTIIQSERKRTMYQIKCTCEGVAPITFDLFDQGGSGRVQRAEKSFLTRKERHND